jgi:hypothetical protein
MGIWIRLVGSRILFDLELKCEWVYVSVVDLKPLFVIRLLRSQFWIGSGSNPKGLA